MLPSQKDIEVPLLEALVEGGGQAGARDIYALVTAKFPDIREEDLAERGLVEEVRVDEKRGEYFISFSRDFVSYWFEQRQRLSAILHYWVTAALAREGFSAAEPIL